MKNIFFQISLTMLSSLMLIQSTHAISPITYEQAWNTATQHLQMNDNNHHTNNLSNLVGADLASDIRMRFFGIPKQLSTTAPAITTFFLEKNDFTNYIKVTFSDNMFSKIRTYLEEKISDKSLHEDIYDVIYFAIDFLILGYHNYHNESNDINLINEGIIDITKAVILLS